MPRLPAWILWPVAAAGCSTHPALRGPMPVRNQHPAQLTVLHLDPVSARPLAAGDVAGRLDTAYSSMFLTGGTAANQFTMDGELLRTSLALRAGLGAGFTAGVELPFVLTTGGFLDSFLIGYHSFFGLPDEDRDAAPRDQFHVEALYQGRTVFRQEPEPLRLADVPLGLDYALFAPAPGTPGLALRSGIELPTGDDQRGLGNGGVDVALGLAAEWPWSWGTCHAQAQHSFAHTPPAARSAGFAFGDVTSAGLGVELPLVDDLALLVQTEWENSTLRALAVREASHDQLLLWTGARVHLDRDLFVEVGLGEDLAALISPDVTFWISLAWLPAGLGP